MWKLLMTAAAGALLLVSACASDRETAPTAAQTAAAVAATPAQPALWAVRDANSTIYLYGTIHLRKTGASWGGPAAEHALAEAEEVWTELEIDPAKEAGVQALVAQYGIDRERTLSSKVDPARVPALRAAAEKIGVPFANLEPMRPWLASLTFTVVPMMQAGYDPNAGVDRTVNALARAAGKKMRWFETNEEQIRFFAGVSDSLQMQMLYESVDEMNEGPAAMIAMEAAWEKGDDAALAREMVSQMASDYPELYEVILKKRNAAWTDVLAREMAGVGVDFVAVGAAHLAGPDSVQSMLRAKGFTVERLTPAPR